MKFKRISILFSPKKKYIFRKKKRKTQFVNTERKFIMNDLKSEHYLERMVPWLKTLPDFLHASTHGPELLYYGTGESNHWPVQSNQNICAALAVMATHPELDSLNPSIRREELLQNALALFRYSIRTHKTGSIPATDGRQWGYHWISVLGLERMAHAINLLVPHLDEKDREQLRKLRLAESDWLLDHYEISAGMIENNKPESNIWNGGFLLRTAQDYPDAPRRNEYLEKSTSFLLNGISHPMDAACERKFRGRTVRERHIGFNFGPDYALDHHGYMNVGYMVICLSNIAMLHFKFKELDLEAPEELYWHAEDLWKRVKNFLFADGRLLRIGGDTRARYTYCQCYAIPMWLLAGDRFGDADAAAFEKHYLGLLKQEQDYCGTGGFLGRRLAEMRHQSYYYYCRLESDFLAALSYGACWRGRFSLPQPQTIQENPPCQWGDDYHGASMIRTGDTIRSWVWLGAQGPVGLCVPAGKSDMAEWQGNLKGRLHGNAVRTVVKNSCRREYSDGFLTWGSADCIEALPLGEGEDQYVIARHQIAVAACPDGRTLLQLELTETVKDCSLYGVYALNLNIPNDLYNRSVRKYAGNTYHENLPGDHGTEAVINTKSDRLNIDNTLAVFSIHGTFLKIHRPNKRNIVIAHPVQPSLRSLYADEICTQITDTPQRYTARTVLIDSGAAVSAGVTLEETLSAPALRKLKTEGRVRSISFRGFDGVDYILIANFEDHTVTYPAGKLVNAFCGAWEKEPVLRAGEAVLLKRT